MKIQVLGSGCATCQNLHKAVEEAVKKLNLEIEVEYSTDIAKIVELGVLSSPVFAINGQVVSSGAVPSNEEIEEAISEKLKNDSLCCEGKNTCGINCSSAEKEKKSSSEDCSCGGSC